jgi:hypothetical protein
MKIYPWLLTLAFAAVCWTCWALTGLTLDSLAQSHHAMLPAITIFLLHPNGWILACPLPWFVYSLVLTVRREITPSALFIFSGSLVLGAAVVFCALLIASVVPFI